MGFGGVGDGRVGGGGIAPGGREDRILLVVLLRSSAQANGLIHPQVDEPDAGKLSCQDDTHAIPHLPCGLRLSTVMTAAC